MTSTTGKLSDLGNMIGGSVLAPINGEYMDSIEPGTGQVLCRIPSSDKEDVDNAVAAAKAALSGPWSKWTTTQRAKLLDDVADLIEARSEELAVLESRDSGKPISVAKNVDIARAASNFRFFAGAVRHDSDECFHMADAINYTQRQPVGVFALVTPWNLPIYLLSWKIAPCLAMGNTCVAKPSELTPVTASALADILKEAGLPDGVFNLVHGDGPKAGQALIEHPDVRGVTFTGGTATGRIVARTAAPQFKKLSLELGGKNSSIVFADCDFEKTVNGVARAAFFNLGQVCLAGSRVFVERSLYPQFLTALVAAAKAMQPNDPSKSDTKLGALVSAAHLSKVEGYVEIAKQEGGVIECGGARPDYLGSDLAKGNYYLPTIVSGLPATARASIEEIFGPVLTIHPFDTEEEVVACANETEYGLAGSVWTQNLTRAHRVCAAVHTGMLWVNCWLHRDLRTPFGGVKNSGVGREGGKHSLEFYSEYKNVCVHLG